MALVSAKDFQLVPDIQGAVGQGIQTAGQLQQLQGISQARDVNEQTQLLTGQILDQSLPPAQRAEAQRQLTALNPQATQQLQQVQAGEQKALSQQDQDQLRSISQGALQVQALPTDDAKLGFLRRRRAEIVERGGNTTETDNVINLFETGQTDIANQQISEAIQVGERLGFIQPASLEKEKLDIKRLEIEAKNAEKALDRETNVLKKQELELKIEEKRKKIDQTQKDIVITAQQAVDSSDIALAAVDRILTHPGLESAVGTSSLIPSIPGTDRANFEAELESFDAKLFASAIKQMKGMGSLSDAEGKKVSAAVGAISPRMTEKAFKTSLGIIKENFEKAKSRTLAQIPKEAAPETVQALPQGITEEDIAETMRANNMTREQVLARLQGGG